MLTASSRRRGQLAGRLEQRSLPPRPEPMLCTLVGQSFDHPDWLFEPKYDGLRVLARFDGRKLTLLSRNSRPQEFQFPEIVEALSRAVSMPILLDGEIVCFDERRRISFRALQQRFHLRDAEEVSARMKAHPASIFLFDILYFDRFDLTGLELGERKKILKSSVRWSRRVLWTPFVVGRGRALLAAACRQGNEGIIGKHRHSLYAGGRSDRWVKLKCIGRQEFVIGGFTDPRRSRVGLGALLVGHYDGDALVYAGKVGTGFTDEMLVDLRQGLDRIEQAKSPFTAGELPPAAHWVRPKLVAQIAFAEWTQNGLLRQPRYEGLRRDKAPKDCRRERPKLAPVSR